MRRIGILGFGEVGQALKELYDESFYSDPLIKDLDRDEFEKDLEVLNICIPYSDNFNSVVIENIKKYEPRLTIIHSTVIPETTKIIRDETKRPVVHSPHRGVHPNLTPSFKKFTRYIGAESIGEGKMAKEHFGFLGIKTGRIKIYQPAAITEFNKLISTTYYGVCIAYTDYVDKLCQKYKIPFSTFTEFNKSYNRGYRRMKMKHVNRPTLYAPGKDGLKSHCIIENCSLLYPYLKDNKLLKSVLALGKDPSVIDGEKHLDRAWLYSEYWGKDKSTKDIGKEVGTTGSNIVQIMKRRGIPKRYTWTKDEIQKLKELSQYKTFKEISEILGKRYSGVRVKAVQLAIKSCYDPGEQDEETRKKISATLQGITLDEWIGFKESVNRLIRKSTEYQEWRKSVFERDNYTCRKYGIKSGNGRMVHLEAHHIEDFAQYPELRFAIDNGITFSGEAHKEFHKRYGKKNNTREQLEEFLNEEKNKEAI